MNPCQVILKFDRDPVRYSSTAKYRQDAETWINIIHQKLACTYGDYKIQVEHDFANEKILVCIIFDNVEDAVAFKLTEMYK